MSVVSDICPDPLFNTNRDQIEAQFDAGAVYNDCRRIAMENNVTVITASQKHPLGNTVVIIGQTKGDENGECIATPIKSRQR